MLYRRKDSSYWWIKITHDGKTIQRSTGTDDKKLAQEYHDKLKAELWNQSKLGEKPKYIWEQAVLKWIEESSHKKSLQDDKMHLRWLDHYLAGKTIQSITKQEIEALTKIRASESVKNATVNRMLALLTPEADKTAYNVGLGIAGWFLLIPWFFMDLKNAEKHELEAYRQRLNNLNLLYMNKKC